jgi:hypothetical protein
MFKHVIFLDHQADLADQSGKDGGPLRNFYQIRANLSPAEAAALKKIARDTESLSAPSTPRFTPKWSTSGRSFLAGVCPRGPPCPRHRPNSRTFRANATAPF